MNGKCLCGAVEFKLSGDIPNLYQCHCSLCRKVTGSSANAAFRISRDRFEWKKGSENISEFVSQGGFKSHFCTTCGSPLPNLTANDGAYWVPVGLLEEAGQLEVVAHLFVGSKAPWDVIADSGEYFDEMPNTQALQRLLQAAKPVL
jgi:hypothetical protein